MILYRKVDGCEATVCEIDPEVGVPRGNGAYLEGGRRTFSKKATDAFKRLPRQRRAWRWDGTCTYPEASRWLKFGWGYSAIANTVGEAKSLIEQLEKTGGVQ